MHSFQYIEGGRHHPDTKEFDEPPLIGGEKRITGLKVWWSNYVLGFETYYEGKSVGKNVGGDQSHSIKDATFQLEEDENIIEIKVYSGDVIDSFSIFTSKGRNTRFGDSTGGGLKELKAPQGTVLRAFKSGIGGHLHFLGCYYGQPIISLPPGISVTKEHGSKHGDTVEFDDFNNFLKYKPSPFKIYEIRLIHDLESVYGLEIFYQFNDGQRGSSGPHMAHPLPQNVHKHGIVLSQDEEIVEVHSRAGGRVDHMKFITNKGQCLQGGGTGGGEEKLQLPGGQKVISFGGGIGGHLHNFKVYYTI